MTSRIKLTRCSPTGCYSPWLLPVLLNYKGTKAKCLPQQVSRYFIFLLCLLFLANGGVIGMQASAGLLDEPGPKLGHKAQRLCCAHKISLKLGLSNRQRDLYSATGAIHHGKSISLAGRASQTNPPPPSPLTKHSTAAGRKKFKIKATW